MKIVLLKSVAKLGERGIVANVKRGYARNYLIPKGFALMHTSSNLKMFEELNRIEIIRKGKKKKEAIQIKEKLEALSLTFPVQAGEDGKLFGAVTNMDIEAALAKEKHQIDKKNILLPEPIKELGIYSVKISLHPKVNATVKLWVVNK